MAYYPGNGKTMFRPEMFQGAEPGGPTSAHLQAQSEDPFYMRTAPPKPVNAPPRANPEENLKERKYAAKLEADAEAKAKAEADAEADAEAQEPVAKGLSFEGGKRTRRSKKSKKTKKSKKSKKSKKTRKH